MLSPSKRANLTRHPFLHCFKKFLLRPAHFLLSPIVFSPIDSPLESTAQNHEYRWGVVSSARGSGLTYSLPSPLFSLWLISRPLSNASSICISSLSLVISPQVGTDLAPPYLTVPNRFSSPCIQPQTVIHPLAIRSVIFPAVSERWPMLSFGQA